MSDGHAGLKNFLVTTLMNLIRYRDKGFNEDNVLFADSSFFRVFGFRLVSGNPATALVNPRSMIMKKSGRPEVFRR